MGKPKRDSEKSLDFTAKNLPEIAERMKNGTITEEELREAAENTSEIVGMPVKWMGVPKESRELFDSLTPGTRQLIEEVAARQRGRFWWPSLEEPKPKQTKLGDKKDAKL